MNIYNQEKTQIIENPDLTKGYLKFDKLLKQIPEQLAVEEQFHIEVLNTYYNEDNSVKGQDVKKVIDVEGKPYIPAHTEEEEIQVFVPYTEIQLLEIQKEDLRIWRNQYFNVIDRAVWYDTLTEEEKTIVKAFRVHLLDITETMKKPQVPDIIAKELRGEN